MAMQHIDRVALHGAIELLISEREDGWLDAAQLVVNACAASPQQPVRVSKYALVRNGGGVDIVPLSRFGRTRISYAVLFDSNANVHTFVRVTYVAAKAPLRFRVRIAITTMLLAVLRIGVYLASFGRRLIPQVQFVLVNSVPSTGKVLHTTRTDLPTAEVPMAELLQKLH